MALTALILLVARPPWLFEAGFDLSFAAALLIASVKGSLVACYFMHLISERRLIFAVIGITVATVVGLLLLPVLAFKRSYSLYYLAQYGREYDVFPQSASVS